MYSMARRALFMDIMAVWRLRIMLSPLDGATVFVVNPHANGKARAAAQAEFFQCAGYHLLCVLIMCCDVGHFLAQVPRLLAGNAALWELGSQ